MTFAAAACLIVLGQNTPPVIGAKVLTPKVAPGRLVSGVVSVAFADGLHGYQNPPSEDYMIPVSVEGQVRGLSVSYPAGHAAKIGGSPVEVMTYSGEIKIPFRFPAATKPGRHSVTLAVGYQQCTDEACFPPGRASVTVTYEVTGKSIPGRVARTGANLRATARQWSAR